MEASMAKKDRKPKVPKKVGGVKLPKDLRKTAKSALKIAENPIAREVVAAALVAGVGALTKRQAEKPAPEGKSKATEIGSLIAQGVAAFVSGLGRPPEPKPDAAPEASAHKPADRPTRRPSTRQE
jgi:hypothetical protein